MITQFKKDIDIGLSKNLKSIPSMYFYDKKGDDIFAQIMNLPEYYITRSELEIFQKQTQKMIDCLNLKRSKRFEIIEFGSGDGIKTKELIKLLYKNSYQFDYIPIDISKNVLKVLKTKLIKEFPKLSIYEKQGDYFKTLYSLKKTKSRKIILFLGSNIGNLSDELANNFIYKIGTYLNKNDKLLLGVDLIKAPNIVLPAYNDSQGVTRRFNLNLLDRINKELDSNFNIKKFKHVPEYDQDEGIAKSYLESSIDQKVIINKIGKTYSFKKGEKIYTEISRKYNDKIIKKVIKNSNLKIIHKLTDEKNYFSDYILMKY